jgi:uracil-DNA glycosylase
MPGKYPTAAPYLPDRLILADLAAAAQKCQGCDLFRNATQAVFGGGAAGAGLFLIGEQPGDREDLQGQPFVGPAGKLLDRALEEAGIVRGEVYVTNAVKHFKFEERGKRRIHKKPGAAEVSACRPWLEAELAAVQPQVVVCMGATAALALLGREFRLTAQRGEILEDGGRRLMATVHPSALLRIPERERRQGEFAAFVEDLRKAASLLKRTA